MIYGRFISNATFVRGSDNIYHAIGENCILSNCQGKGCCPKIEKCEASCEAGICYQVFHDEQWKVLFFPLINILIIRHFGNIIYQYINIIIGYLLFGRRSSHIFLQVR